MWRIDLAGTIGCEEGHIWGYVIFLIYKEGAVQKCIAEFTVLAHAITKFKDSKYHVILSYIE